MRLGFCDLENLLELPGPLPLPPAAEPAKDEDVLLELKIPSLKLTENRPLENEIPIRNHHFYGLCLFQGGYCSYTDIHQYGPESSKGFRCQAYHHSTSATSLCRRPRHVCQCFWYACCKSFWLLPSQDIQVKYISQVTPKIHKHPKFAPWK